MTDTSLMLFGKHKGEKLINVPASYLLWLLDNGKCGAELKAYILDNKQVLEKEIKK